MQIYRSLPKHKNLVGFYDGVIKKDSEGNTIALFLMEYCGDGTIFDLMAKHEKTKLKEKVIFQALLQVATAIKVMHQQSPPIAHRDIKIENVLRKGNVFKLCDFGSCTSRVIDVSKYQPEQYYKLEEEFLKSTTPMYRPPEMADLYLKYKIDEKVDIWMLGCIAFTMCFYTHPFLECSKLAISKAKYIFPSQHKYSEKMCDLIRLLLTPDPLQRPSINEVVKIMQNFQNLSKIPLNKQAQQIKQEQLKQFQKSQKMQQNFKKFGSKEIPIEELMKIKSQIGKKESKPYGSKSNKNLDFSSFNTNETKLKKYQSTKQQRGSDPFSEFDSNDFSSFNSAGVMKSQSMQQPNTQNQNFDLMDFGSSPTQKPQETKTVDFNQFSSFDNQKIKKQNTVDFNLFDEQDQQNTSKKQHTDFDDFNTFTAFAPQVDDFGFQDNPKQQKDENPLFDFIEEQPEENQTKTNQKDDQFIGFDFGQNKEETVEKSPDNQQFSGFDFNQTNNQQKVQNNQQEKSNNFDDFALFGDSPKQPEQQQQNKSIKSKEEDLLGLENDQDANLKNEDLLDLFQNK